MHRYTQLALLLTLAVAPAEVQACRIRPTEAQTDAEYLSRFDQAWDAVDVETLSSPDGDGWIQLRVQHSYKGALPSGVVVVVRMADFTCGCFCFAPGAIPRQGRSLVLLSRADNGELRYDGPLAESEIARLQRLGRLADRRG